MKYFWHFVISIGILSFILFAFFGASLSFENKVAYTDQDIPTEPSVTFIDPTLGPATARATIVLYGDYGCDACATLDETLITLIADDFPTDVRLVWKDMPNTSQHKEALNAAVAARCAEDQDAFWEYHALLIANHDSLSPELYSALAKQLGLKENTFASCYNNQTPAPVIQQTHDEGVALGVTATPTIFINGARYTGAVDSGTLKAMIRQILAQKP
jgi:protein-disulfide isomerase